MVELEIRGLGFRYGGRTVFEGVSFCADRGEIVSLVGPNGAGKTTLMKCVNRLHAQREGRILVNGTDVARMDRGALARRVAYVPQAESAKFPISVFDAVLLGRRPHMGWRTAKKDLDLVFDVLCQLEIDDLADKSLDNLSGGERQKVMLAKAIVQEPEVLLLDEPTTFLDMGYQLRIMRFIRRLVDEKRLCAVMATHELNYALAYSDRIAILKDGRLAACGAPDVVMANVIREVYGVDAVIRTEAGRPYIVPRV